MGRMEKELTQHNQLPVVSVDIISDAMCPWCYIGKRNFEAATNQLCKAFDVRVRWLPFQLDPTLPKAGKDRQTYLSDKFGSSERAAAIYERIRQAGAEVGLAFDFDAITVSPNTFDAHRLITWASGLSPECLDRVVEALFRAYFMDGENIGDSNILRRIGLHVGGTEADLSDVIDGGAYAERVSEMLSVVSKAGIGGVPTYIFNAHHILQGAQPPQVIAKTIEMAGRDSGS